MPETVRETPTVVIESLSSNMRIHTMREDVNEGFSITVLGGDCSARLLHFAYWQIGTCPQEIMGSDDRRQTFFNKILDSHPVDTVPPLIVTEPVLMLSNLTNNQLMELMTELWDATTDSNRRHVTSAQRIIQGILIGRESANLR